MLQRAQVEHMIELTEVEHEHVSMPCTSPVIDRWHRFDCIYKFTVILIDYEMLL